MTDPLRIAIYVRQSVEEPQGISQQLEDCHAEANRRGWTVVDTYEDDDVSGSKKRGAKTDWSRMLDDYDRGLFDGVLANDVDRLTRSLADVLELRPPKRDVRVLTVRGGIDTADDDTTLKMLVLMAEREVRLKTIRAQRYAVERRKQGHPAAGHTAYGYRWVRAADRDAAGTRFRIDEHEARIVRRIFNEFLSTGDGAKLAQIARDLNDEGHRTRKGARWHTPTIRRILINPHYAALLPPVQPEGQNDMAKVQLEACTPGAWEAIVPEEQLVAARAVLVGRQPKHQGTARSHLLSGIPTCSVCGGPVRSCRARTHPTKRKDGEAAESKHHAAYRCIDGHFVRRADHIDEFISEVVIDRLSQDDAADLLEPVDNGPDLGVLNALRSELRERDAAIASLIARGKMGVDAAEKALDELAAELGQVEEQISVAAARDPLADVITSDDVRTWWEGATLSRRRAVIETLMDIVIRPVGPGTRPGRHKVLRVRMDALAETVEIAWKRG